MIAPSILVVAVELVSLAVVIVARLLEVGSPVCCHVGHRPILVVQRNGTREFFSFGEREAGRVDGRQREPFQGSEVYLSLATELVIILSICSSQTEGGKGVFPVLGICIPAVFPLNGVIRRCQVSM